MAMLTVSKLHKKEKDKSVVKDISFIQQPLQKIAIAGETGSGKTTLLKMIAGLVQPDGGEILFNDEKVVGPFDKLIPGHPGMAYLSQHFELRNNYRVEEELEAVNQLPENEARSLYTVCRIEHLLKRRTDQLSGGERQRIVLARLLSTSPRLLLLDEPFSNLDARHKQIIKTVIHDIGTKMKISCIMVSHDALDLLSWADTILVMKDGEIIQEGTPQQIYAQPKDEYTAALLGDYNLINNSSLLAAIPGIHVNGKQLLIRPEHFMIVPPGDHLLKGIVKAISFRGSYYLIDVVLAEQCIRIQASDANFSVGNTVFFSLAAEKIAYL